MTTLPTWIEDRLDPNLDHKLTQRHVVETMLEAERPFFSVTQLQVRLKPDVSGETVRNRLDELREIDVLAAETYPDTITLYYVNHPQSNWPLSPEGHEALTRTNPLDRLSLRDFLTLSDPAGIRTLVLAGLQLSFLTFCLGVVFSALGIHELVSSTQSFWTTSVSLLLVSIALLGAERLARWARGRDGTISSGDRHTAR
ncbi:hypothetical protein L593_02730 [Salinarchaeum sp. Harcht-Bsk1]|uniref:hypothetical protein n=1 Tax=Salinarchaeum sp. Harcht-Bsk1 TaxID=1333523 RepID=UPI0003422A43|nr:hypothetical protein [Salinarchaeum sp. Harcht-Bsk1]AGN00497.1 hypothetical protein L593_02730 [Salinarchaeum sp. Harcht-Bsk1]